VKSLVVLPGPPTRRARTVTPCLAPQSERFAGDENEPPADGRVAICEAVDFGLSSCFDRELLASVPGFILVANEFLLARISLSDAAGPACRMPGA
jgi:hypothetical protein